MVGAWDPETALAQSAPTTNSVVVSQEDKRVPIDRRSEKYKQLNAVGAFFESDRLIGSGFLLDKCHVLTDAHVAYEEFASNKIIDVDKVHVDEHKRLLFAVGVSSKYPKGFVYGIEGAVITHGTTDGSVEDSSEDWALIKLDRSLPSDFPTIPIFQVPDIQATGFSLIGVGFPADRTNRGTDFSFLYGDLNCRIVANMGESYYAHNCQATGGDSGGPLLIVRQNGSYSAVGMMTGRHAKMTGLEKSDNYKEASVAVSFGPGVPSDPQNGLEGVLSPSDEILKAVKDSPCP